MATVVGPVADAHQEPQNDIHVHQIQPTIPSGSTFPPTLTAFNFENFDAQLPGLYDEFGGLPYGVNFVNPDFQFQDMPGYTDYPMNFGTFEPSFNQSNPDTTMPNDPGEASSGSSEATSSILAISIPHTRSTSITSRSDEQMDLDSGSDVTSKNSSYAKGLALYNMETIIAAESAWPLARCNSPTFSGSCPRTAILHLEGLESSRNDESWLALQTMINNDEFFHCNEPFIERLTASSRDNMLAITQGFLQKALQIHRGGMNSRPKSSSYMNPEGFKFLVLPPNPVLEYFLHNCARSLSTFYALEPGGRIDPNELMLNTQASTLLVLLMIAQGASIVPTTEARTLAAGLTETCRISLFDIIEKDVELSADPIVLKCALILTTLGAWSGDKWHVSVSLATRSSKV